MSSILKCSILLCCLLSLATAQTSPSKGDDGTTTPAFPPGCAVSIANPGSVDCVNAALNQQTFWSSLYTGHTKGFKAVDGNTDSQWRGLSCFCSQRTAYPWIAIDLRTSYMVYRVDVVNRGDCCGERLNTAVMGVTDVSPDVTAPTITSITTCAAVGDGGAAAGETIARECNEEGRYVVVMLNTATPEYLTVCEIKAYVRPSEHHRNLQNNMPEGCRRTPPTGDCFNIARGKRTWQTNDQHPWTVSGKAIDGDTSGLYRSLSITCTGNVANPWWMIDLLQDVTVWKVVIYNRDDGWYHQLTDLLVGFSGQAPPTYTPNKDFDVCAVFYGIVLRGEFVSLDCGKSGQYLVIQRDATGYLTMAEVMIYTENSATRGFIDYTPLEGCTADEPNPTCPNVALGKDTRQSSIGWYGHSGRAVDGNRDGNYWSLSCTHTGRTRVTNNYVAIDLEYSRRVEFVTVSNRRDCCSNRLDNFYIVVTDTHPDTEAVTLDNSIICAVRNGQIPAGDSVSLDCGATGRFVALVMPQMQWLTVCEMEVYAQESQATLDLIDAIPTNCDIDGTGVGCGAPNVALNKQAYQSSSYQYYTQASAATDGDTNGQWRALSMQCTTRTESNPWWACDLETSRLVQVVRLHNREDCCPQRLSHLIMGVTDVSVLTTPPALTNFDVCNRYYGQIGAGASKAFRCLKSGRYFIIQLDRQEFLTMAEVEIIAVAQPVDQGLISFNMPAGCDVNIPNPQCSTTGPTCCNLGVNQPAVQSSTGWNGLPGRAVDGNRAGRWSSLSCSHTLRCNPATDPTCTSTYWAVDLGSSKQVYRVDIHNRLDCCGYRLKYFTVGCTDSDPTVTRPTLSNIERCAIVNSRIPSGGSVAVSCGCTGRYLAVVMPFGQWLTLCEVEVYG